MPRQSVDIERFAQGITCGVMSEDIPDDACEWSKNLDNFFHPGSLSGRKTDSTVTLGKGFVRGSFLKVSDDKGYSSYDLMYRGDDGNIRVRTDFYGASPVETALVDVTGSTYTRFVPFGQEMRIARGKAEDPLLIRKADVEQFNRLPSGEYLVAPAAVVPASIIPFFHKTVGAVISGDSYAFGFQYGDSRLYKVNCTDDTVEVMADGAFGQIRAICKDFSGDYLWVFDQTSGSANGRFQRVNMSTLAIDRSGICGTMAGFYTYVDQFGVVTTIDRLVTDMIHTDIDAGAGNLWIAGKISAWPVGATDAWKAVYSQYSLFACATPTGIGVSCTMVNRTPVFVSGIGAAPAEAGDWSLIPPVTGGYRTGFTYISEFFDLSLVYHDDANYRVGWLIRVAATVTNDGTQTVYYRRGNPSSEYLQITQPFLYLSSSTLTAGDRSQVTIFPEPIPSGSAASWHGIVINSDDVYVAQGQTVWKATGVTPPTKSDGYAALVGAFTKTPIGHYLQLGERNGTTVWAASHFTEGRPLVASFSTAVTPAYTEQYSGSAVVLTDGVIAGTWSTYTRYFYAISFVYNSSQESVLSVPISRSNTTGTQARSLLLTIKDYTQIHPFVSHINIYKAHASEPAGTTAASPETFYRLVTSISTADKGWMQVGSELQFSYNDYLETSGPSFESNAGFSEVLESTSIRYEDGIMLNGYFFAIRCWQEISGYMPSIMFRSKQYRHDTFDWTTDFVELPFIPTAIIGWNGSIFCFSESQICRVNPEGMIVEETIDGRGAFGPDAVLTLDVGLVFADINGVHLYNGRDFVNLMAPNLTVANSFLSTPTRYSWSNVTTEKFIPFLGYSQKHSLLFVFADYGDSLLSAYVYSFILKRWDFWTFNNGSGEMSSLFGGKGEMYYNEGGTLYAPLEGASYKAWEWVSKVFVLDGGRNTKLYLIRVKVQQTGGLVVAPQIYYRRGDADYWTLITDDYVTFADREMEKVQTRIVGAANDARVHHIHMIYRPLGLR